MNFWRKRISSHILIMLRRKYFYRAISVELKLLYWITYRIIVSSENCNKYFFCRPIWRKRGDCFFCVCYQKCWSFFYVALNIHNILCRDSEFKRNWNLIKWNTSHTFYMNNFGRCDDKIKRHRKSLHLRQMEKESNFHRYPPGQCNTFACRCVFGYVLSSDVVNSAN